MDGLIIIRFMGFFPTKRTKVPGRWNDWCVIVIIHGEQTQRPRYRCSYWVIYRKLVIISLVYLGRLQVCMKNILDVVQMIWVGFVVIRSGVYHWHVHSRSHYQRWITYLHVFSVIVWFEVILIYVWMVSVYHWLVLICGTVQRRITTIYSNAVDIQCSPSPHLCAAMGRVSPSRLVHYHLMWPDGVLGNYQSHFHLVYQ